MRQKAHVATFYALSPAALAQQLAVDVDEDWAAKLSGLMLVAPSQMAELVKDTEKFGSCVVKAYPGRTVTISPGWAYVVEFMQNSVSLSVETLRVDRAVAHAGAAALVSRLVGQTEKDRLGVVGVLLSALAVGTRS